MTISKTEAFFAATFPSYRDFVDDALFHPEWGYYSRGLVRFGDGGHYDTYPIALSPYFGRMVARYAQRVWVRWGRPRSFEICELGAGNGQLCLDAVLYAAHQAKRFAGWRSFEKALRYRIVERSTALIERQQRNLGEAARRVVWTRADLSQRTPRGLPFGKAGVLIANEVLDCLAHHKVVPQKGLEPAATVVVPVLKGRVRGVRFAPSPAFAWAVPRSELPAILCDDDLRQQLSFHEVQVSIECFPKLERFMRRHYPEFFPSRGAHPAYFACPEIEVMMRNAAKLYDRMEAIWIDYGGLRSYHLRSAEHRRVAAGPPRSGASVYRDPGHDDVTFMVDFSVVERAAQDAGFQVTHYGEQGELARFSGVDLDDDAVVETILQHRALGWLLALTGASPESSWRRGSITWRRAGGPRRRLRQSVRADVDEFLGRSLRPFWMMMMRK